MLKAVIFDMDGTMVSTENIWGQINHRLAEKYGKKFDVSVRIKMMGQNDFNSLSIFRTHHAIDVSVEELIRTRREMMLSSLTDIKTQPGLIELLDLLEKRSFKKAIATGSFRKYAEKVLLDTNLKGRFDFLITGDDVEKGKPDPMMFLKAAEFLQVNPVECLVLEDAQNGVEAAASAGMKVYAIPTDHSRHHDFSKADKILKSLEQITEELLS